MERRLWSGGFPAAVHICGKAAFLPPHTSPPHTPPTPWVIYLYINANSPRLGEPGAVGRVSYIFKNILEMRGRGYFTTSLVTLLPRRTT